MCNPTAATWPAISPTTSGRTTAGRLETRRRGRNDPPPSLDRASSTRPDRAGEHLRIRRHDTRLDTFDERELAGMTIANEVNRLLASRLLNREDTDLIKADLVEVRISPDGTKLWVAADGINRFRVYHSKRVIVHDDR